MASLLSNGRKSRLDMPIGIDESRAAQAQDRADRNTVLALKANKTDIRLGRRAYRAAIRGGDVGAISALPILEKMRAVTGTTGGGVQMANTLQPAVEKKIQHTREKIDSFGNKTLDDNGKLAPRQQSRILGNGSGLTPQDAKTSSNGGEWVDVSGKPMATTLEVRGAAPSTAPLGSGRLPIERPSERPNPRLPFDTRRQFASDLTSSRLIQEGDNAALQRATERGSKLGVSRSSLISFLNRGLGNRDDLPALASRLLSTPTPSPDQSERERAFVNAPREFDWNNTPPSDHLSAEADVEQKKRLNIMQDMAAVPGYDMIRKANMVAMRLRINNNDPRDPYGPVTSGGFSIVEPTTPSAPPATPSAFTPEDRGLVSDLQSASRILRDYRSSQNNELTQSRVNPTGQSPMLGLASRLFGGSVDSGSSFASGPTPSLSAPASRLVSDPSARPVAINSPPPTSSSRLNVKWGEWENTSPEYLIPREKARAKKQAQDAKNKELTTRKSSVPGLLTRMGMNKPTYLEGTIAGGIFDAVNK